MTLDFNLVWDLVKEIPSAVGYNEAKAMFDIVMDLPDESTLVEIGSYLGRSSGVLGQVALVKKHEFTCIDNFQDIYQGQDMEDAFKRNMNRKFIKYQLVPWESKRAVHLFSDSEISFIFIDANHHYEGVALDIKLWLPKVKDGGFVLFHDYGSSWLGVKKAIDECHNISNRNLVESLMVTRKI